MDWGQLPQQVVNGVQTGAVYSLIALGYTMVYGVLRLINFAHGDIYMVGAYFAYYTAIVWFPFQTAMQWMPESIRPYAMLLLMLVVAMAGCALLGVIIERLAYRPLRNAPRISVLITAVGVSLFLEYAGRLVVQTSPQPAIVQEVNVLAKPFEFAGITIQQSQLAVLAVTLVLMAALWMFVSRTPMGRAMRAVSHDFSTASLMGVNVDRVVIVTFVIGSSLAGAAGMMTATAFGTPLNTFLGLMPGVKAFVAAVLGGIGNIPGAVVGGLIMGVAEALVVWTGYGGYRDAVAFVILIVILLFRPGGLFGSAPDKV